ncbi:Uncharacterized protein Fot_05846 [Forsythia ovata]|uniref:Transposase MuDR plant domain-containing protein n=1 Tax=Forsythia ovata TaxID=205694 RepID=A0ABD1WRN8_9LAMI
MPLSSHLRTANCFESFGAALGNTWMREMTSHLSVNGIVELLFVTEMDLSGNNGVPTTNEPGENSDATDTEPYFNDLDYSLGEDDDLIFEQNVTSSIELDARKERNKTNETNDSHSLENPPPDELRSVYSNSEEEVVQYPEFNAEKEMLILSLKWKRSFDQERNSRQQPIFFSINSKFEVRFPVNNANRVKAICKGDKCL